MPARLGRSTAGRLSTETGVAAPEERRGGHAERVNITDAGGRITHLAVTHELRRAHDGSVISSHCCRDCAWQALESLTLPDLLGDNPPGLLQWAEVHVVVVATGARIAFTRGLVPLDQHAPAQVTSYP